MTADAGRSGTPGDEDHQERTQRQLIELLNELRVAIPGVQVLFAFLLTIPFNQRFERVDMFQETVYFVTLLLTALASCLLIAPTAYHRLNFHQRDRDQVALKDFGKADFEAWTRKLDRLDRSWRE